MGPLQTPCGEGESILVGMLAEGTECSFPALPMPLPHTPAQSAPGAPGSAPGWAAHQPAGEAPREESLGAVFTIRLPFGFLIPEGLEGRELDWTPPDV